jgi:putative hydroxymethylpyrimidine transport system substrate-binding protein
MLSKRVDATLGAFWNYEGVDLKRRRRDPSILRVDRLGVPTYAELVLAARTDDLDERGASRIRRFLQATARGHQRVRDNPRTGVDAVVKANPDLDRGLQEAVVRATLPVFFPEDPKLPFGYQVPETWQAYGEWMLANKLVEQQPNAATALTNEFLPGQGLKPTE